MLLAGWLTFSFSPKAFELQHDFLLDNGNAYPEVYDGHPESHGTACAGEIGMRKGNGICGVGVAYNSFITGQYQESQRPATVSN